MQKIKSFDGSLFDLDGTLLDSLDVWADVDRKFLQKRGFAVPPDYQQAVMTLNFSEAADYTISRFSLKESPEAVMDEWMRMTREAYATRVELKPYAKEYLLKLVRSGVKLAVATSSACELFEPALKRNGVYDLFAAFVTTREAGRGKHFPDVYFSAARKLGLPPERCAVFEDVPTAVKTAHDAGFYTVAVLDSASRLQEEFLRTHSDFFLNSYSELLSD